MDTEEKTRRLKKYEATHEPAFTLGDGVPVNFYSPFGPMIAEFQIPDYILQTINDYADSICEENQGAEFIVPSSIVFSGGGNSLAETLNRFIKRYVETIDCTKVKSVQLDTAWIISQYALTPSPVHFHSSDVSGVFYLKSPEVDPEQEARNYISGRKAGFINFLSGGKQSLSKSLISFPPTVGRCLIFPGWLLHGTEAFSGSGERRSLAFNASILPDAD